ncbi:MAG TPA: HD domain-containing phosphohydrolase [Casimicrobiaceae bacterium]|nr:HD domain-containing phosphohydrolase [Casimicrobiaceae bacterium]
MTEYRAPARILIVDDELRNIRLLESLLRPEGYDLAHACSGPEALEQLQTYTPDLILLDIMMPEMDGYELAGRLKLDPRTKPIPIIMITSLDDRSARLAALNMGAEEFLNKPVDRAELWVRVRNLLRLKFYGDQLASQARMLEQRVLERTAQLSAAYLETLETLNRAASHRDEETGAHVRRISVFCVEIAGTLGLDSDFVDTIAKASPMHDIGKIAIPDRILMKQGPLDATEWQIMQTHTTAGARMLDGATSPFLRMGREIALSHHERWDGTGYPEGLAGEAIPLAARIMSIADVYDALRSERCYKTAIDHDEAVAVITRGDGRTTPAHFDPQVLEAFRRCSTRFDELYRSISEAEEEPQPWP